MGTSTGLHPRVERFYLPVPAVATAGNTDENPVIKAPFTGVVQLVSYVPKTTITGAATNTRKVSLLNKGQAGAGTTEAAGLQFNNGVNAPAFDEKAITLSGTTADLNVVAGDVLSFKSAAVGTGIVDPGGLLVVELARD